RILAAAIPVVLVTASVRALLAARQRFATITAVTIPASVLNILIPLAGALGGWTLGRISAWLLPPRTPALATLLPPAHPAMPTLLGGLAPRRDRMRELLGFGLWTALTNALAPVYGSLDRFLLGYLRNMDAVGFYTSPQELVLRLTILPSSLTSTLFPALTSL